MIASVSQVCEEPEVDWKSLAGASSHWKERQHAARQVHLKLLKEHDVYETGPVPPGVKPLSVRWVDVDHYDVAKSRLTARGFEQ